MRLTYLGVLVAALLAISACGGATTSHVHACCRSAEREPGTHGLGIRQRRAVR